MVQVAMASPINKPYLYLTEFAHKSTPVDLFDLDPKMFPLAQQAPDLEVVRLGLGDCLFVPENWFV